MSKAGLRMTLGTASMLLLAALAPSPLTASPPDPASESLLAAAQSGNVTAVGELIRQGAQVGFSEGDGMTALHWAAYNGHEEVVRQLLDAAAPLEAETRNGAYRPLHLASQRGHAAIVKDLVAAGADVNGRTSTGGVTPLHFAAQSGNVEGVNALLAAGAQIDAREEFRAQTPLIFAASFDRVDAVRSLLAGGADWSLASRVVHYPTEQEIDRIGGERRAEVLDVYRQEAGSPEGWRPTPEQVQAAVKAGHEAQRELLLARAGEIENVDREIEIDLGTGEVTGGFSGLVGTQGGFTALHHAVREGNARSVRALLEGGVDVNQVSAGGTSPLLMATINGHLDLALELLSAGADPNLVSEAGDSPLYTTLNVHWAPRARYPQQHAHMFQDADYLQVMEALLEAGADPNLRLNRHLWYLQFTFDHLNVDTSGSTPFWRAAYALDLKAMRLLLDYGADPEIPTRAPAPRRRGGYGAASQADASGLPPAEAGGPGVSPIHAASGVGYGQGYAGNVHRHVPGGWLPAVKFLVEELGADVNARDHEGYSPLHHAAARGDDEMIRYLVAQGADVTVVSRRGQTVTDMANGPVQRIRPFPSTIALTESLGSYNNHNCLSC